ncbi:hypothetical protein N7507_007577 [Penicillium longicatenatum]|nr:hypothetical protein N7507_007577 [Penicillium longicatenatum]
MTGEGAKVIDLLTDLVGHPREATTPDIDVRLLGIDLAYVVTHGCHPVEAMGVQEVVHLLNTGVAPEPLPSRAEPLGLVRTVGGVLPPDGSLRGERTDPDLLYHHGDPSLLTAKADRVIYLVAAAAQGVSGMYPLGFKVCAQPGGIPPQSSYWPVSPAHAARPESSTTSKRSSPATGPDRGGLTSRKSRSRSPTRSSPPLDLLGSQDHPMPTEIAIRCETRRLFTLTGDPAMQITQKVIHWSLFNPGLGVMSQLSQGI